MVPCVNRFFGRKVWNVAEDRQIMILFWQGFFRKMRFAYFAAPFMEEIHEPVKRHPSHYTELRVKLE